MLFLSTVVKKVIEFVTSFEPSNLMWVDYFNMPGPKKGYVYNKIGLEVTFESTRTAEPQTPKAQL